VILHGGAKGKRFALPNSRILIHQASTGGLQGTAADIEIHAREIPRLNARLAELLAADTGQPLDRTERDINRDYWMSAREMHSPATRRARGRQAQIEEQDRRSLFLIPGGILFLLAICKANIIHEDRRTPWEKSYLAFRYHSMGL
jgi:hypothetical protein